MLMFELDAQTKNIDLQIQLDTSLRQLDGNWVIADHHRLTQILVNFTTNAFKATVSKAPGLQSNAHFPHRWTRLPK